MGTHNTLRTEPEQGDPVLVSVVIPAYNAACCIAATLRSVLTQTIRETGAGEVWVTHGEEDALVHWCGTVGIKAQPLHLVGYGDDDEEPRPAPV